MVKYLLHCSSAGKQQNIKLKNFKKKLLTDNNGNVIINELSLRQQKRILKSCWQTRKIMVNYSGCRKTTEILEKEKQKSCWQATASEI